jgi:hypothetical protein
MCAGADSIDDLDVVRTGGMKTLFGGVYAPSTIGTLLREFAFGHSRQLESVLRHHLAALRGRVELLRGAEHRVFVDIDSLLRPVDGHAKQGASYASTAHPVTAWLIVRRVKDACYRDALFPVWRYHPFFTDTDDPVDAADITHRQHAIIETVFADLIDGPLAHMASGHFGANSAWILCAAIAHNLLRAVGALVGRTYAVARGATLRRRNINIPARLARPNADPNAPTQPLALGQTLACTMAQHDWKTTTTTCDTLTTADRPDPKDTQEKLGTPATSPCPQSENPDQNQPAPTESVSRWIVA